MSMDHHMMANERVCYVYCNFCNTTLAVSVPCSSGLLSIVTVRCGHCANLLTVNLAAASFHQSTTLLPPPPLPPQDHHHHHQWQKQHLSFQEPISSCKELAGSSSSKCSNKVAAAAAAFDSPVDHHDQPSRIPPIRPPEKRQRVPSAYNRFIKEEIQRIKASNPDISHREAFSTAAKNWAHFPHIHFGLKMDGNKQAKLDQGGGRNQ